MENFRKFYFFKTIFDTSFRPSRKFFGTAELICTNGKRAEFRDEIHHSWVLRNIYPNREPAGLPMSWNGKQPSSVHSPSGTQSVNPRPPVSDHPKCKDSVVAYRRWSFKRGFNDLSCKVWCSVAYGTWSLTVAHEASTAWNTTTKYLLNFRNNWNCYALLIFRDVILIARSRPCNEAQLSKGVYEPRKSTRNKP